MKRIKKNLYYYEYERKILEAACVDKKKDSDEDISRKVNILSKTYPDEFACTSENFEITKGNILKLAVAQRLDDLIQDAVHIWKIDLNKVDLYDNLTVLDYVKKIRDLQTDSTNIKILQGYYDTLLEAGAKHRSEIK